jgi:Protein of unknown function (DUF2934)
MFPSRKVNTMYFFKGVAGMINSIVGENGEIVEVQDGQNTILDGIQDAIREKAYLLWEAAGRPDGDGTEFWLKAEEELSA